MTDYTAKDGLKVLEYLGFAKLSEHEKKVFENKWNELYLSRDKNLIGTTWTLYAQVLPFAYSITDRWSIMTANYRDNDFRERLETTKLDKELNKGILLEQILEKKV